MNSNFVARCYDETPMYAEDMARVMTTIFISGEDSDMPADKNDLFVDKLEFDNMTGIVRIIPEKSGQGSRQLDDNVDAKGRLPESIRVCSEKPISEELMKKFRYLPLT